MPRKPKVAPPCSFVNSPEPYRVQVYEGHGVMITGHIAPGNPTGKGGGKRGKVKGWSPASRRRMREFLLTHRPPESWVVVGATFTIPGSPMEPTDAKRLFLDWCTHAAHDGWCAVWRLEVQQRGQLHWHLLVCLDPEVPEVIAGAFAHPGARCDTNATASQGDPVREDWGALTVKRSWEDAIRRAGAYDDGQGVYDHRMGVFGADRHAAMTGAVRDEDCGPLLRYLQDHATKAKQEQVAVGMGRHWGVVGRKHWERVLSDEDAKLTPTEYSRFLRALQRLATPSRKVPCIFGRKLGFRQRRGRVGRSVWFSRPETIRRLVAWARSAGT